MSTYFEPTTITVEAAIADLRGGSDKARVAAATALGDIIDNDLRKRIVPALIDALSEPVAPLRAAAATSLAELGVEAAVEPLILCLDDLDMHVRQTAAIALGKLGFSAGFDALAGLLASGPPDLRFQAATSLAEIDAERARGPLLSALAAEKDDEVVGALSLSLAAITARGGTDADPTQVAAAISKHLDNGREITRFEVAYALARLGDPGGVDVLASFIDHKSLSWDAVEGLEMAGTAAAARALGGLVERRLARTDLRLRAAAGVLDIGQGVLDPGELAAARQLLVDGLRSLRLHRRALAVQLLGQVGDRRAVSALEKLKAGFLGRPLVDDIDAAIASIKERR